MAKFVYALPQAIIDEHRRLIANADKIFGAMTRAGAEVVQKQIKATVPLPEMASHVELSVTYKTPTDDGINTKVYFKGYVPFSGNRKWFVRRNRAGGKVYRTDKGVPTAFLAQVYEYGRSDPSFPKKPFIRKAFGQKSKIEKVMFKAQKEASGGILDDK